MISWIVFRVRSEDSSLHRFGKQGLKSLLQKIFILPIELSFFVEIGVNIAFYGMLTALADRAV